MIVIYNIDTHTAASWVTVRSDGVGSDNGIGGRRGGLTYIIFNFQLRGGKSVSSGINNGWAATHKEEANVLWPHNVQAHRIECVSIHLIDRPV